MINYLRNHRLCGKDKRAVCHEGSVRFRRTIDQYRERYCSDLTSKQEKMNITKEIVAKVRQSSRFLKYDSKRKVWRTISALAARDKVSHALRFAHFKENRKTGKAKHSRRRLSANSAASSGSPKTQSSEDTELWHSFVSRQTKLLESIKKGKTLDKIPAFVELPKPTKVSTTVAVVSEGSTDFDPLCINDNSFDESFQDYCLQLHRSEKDITNCSSQLHNCRTNLNEVFHECEELDEYQLQGNDDEDEDDDCDGANDGASSGKCLYEDNSEGNDESPDDLSQTCGGDDIASMITEPLMEWDLEHDGIFEV